MKILHFQPDHNLKLRKSQLIVLHLQLSPEVESLPSDQKMTFEALC